MIQPSSPRSACSVTAGSVSPCSSCPRLPMGSSCQSIASPVCAAAARMTLTHSGTTSRPMSSPGRIPIFKARAFVLRVAQRHSRGSGNPVSWNKSHWVPAFAGTTNARMSGSRAETAVDEQRLAGDEIRCAAREEHGRAEQVRRLRETSELDAAEQALGPFRIGGHRAGGEVRQGGGRREGVDAHPALRPFGRKRRGEMRYGGLGGAVGALSNIGGCRPGGAQIDDLAVAARYHQRADLLRAEESAPYVGVEQHVPFLLGGFQRGLRETEPGVIHQHEPAVVLLRQPADGIRQIADVAELAHICSNDFGAPAGRDDPLPHGFEHVFAPARQNNVGAGAGEALGKRLPDAFAGSGHDDQPIVEPERSERIARCAGRHGRMRAQDRNSSQSRAGRGTDFILSLVGASYSEQDRTRRARMSKAFRIYQTGGPEVMRWEDVEVGEPGPGQVRLRHSAVGLNFRDVLVRRGAHAVKSLPSGIGIESAGVIDALGPGVTGLSVGQRVACVAGPDGAYAEARLVPAARVVPLPEEIDERTAASMMVRGMTARYLLRETYAVKRGDTILVHAAAGGACLRPRGMLVSFGEASGDPEPIAPRRLGQLGSIYLTHPSLPDYTATRAALLATAGELFDMVKSGKIKIEINQTYALMDAPRAHRDLESRQTTGSAVLVP